ncbi:hypothetical protein GH714_033741 [Hevea brasiliensis]|uniref:DUS-like FMN-binding domain-containing protein n=1 Tax=Hevea brasiliensis TaxID=3981 RepID=A0A6A6L6N4_HEVBR|nr:hypothetical protein GH714_033741 [Hevea brasiliensis]
MGPAQMKLRLPIYQSRLCLPADLSFTSKKTINKLDLVAMVRVVSISWEKGENPTVIFLFSSSSMATKFELQVFIVAAGSSKDLHLRCQHLFLLSRVARIPTKLQLRSSGCVESGNKEIGFGLFRDMCRLGVRHDNYSFASVLIEDSIHDQITYNVMINGLVSVGRVEEALIMFRKMLGNGLRPTEFTFRLEGKDIVSWNTMISSYAQENFGTSAILTYLEMQRTGIRPDEFTFGSLLAGSELVETVEMIHSLLFRNSLISNIQVSNALISAYSKLGNMKQAYQIFCDQIYRNLISWNTIISGFLLNGLPMQGLEQFSELLMSEFRPNEYTLSIILSICASILALRQGKQVHGYIMRLGFSSKSSLGNALITMYAKCGLMHWSLRVFNAMTKRDLVSWNALISAYAQHGKGNEAVHWFEAMQDSCGVQPDEATFTIILSACSHAGLVDDGIRIFNSMVCKCGVVPGVGHFSCIVDLLGRAGHFDEVEMIMNNEHFEPHPNIWWTLLSACAAHGNLKLGRLVAGFLLETEQDNPSVYVLLSNMYAAAGQWEEAANVRRAADRPRDPARWSEIAVVVSALSVPVIANGDVFDYGDFERIEVATGASSVIVARGALLNASVFSPDGKGYWEEVKGDCVKKVSR